MSLINDKNSSGDTALRGLRITIADVFANQHPVINGWIMLSAMAIVALYAITFTTL